MDETADEKTFRKATETLAVLEGPELTEFVELPMRALNGQPPESGFGARVKAARTHYSLNVEALSRLTKSDDKPEGRGVSGAAISRYEAGEALPGAREFRMIAESLGLSADWLLFGTIKTGGSTGGQQRLIAALLEVIGEQQPDANTWGTKESESVKLSEQRARLKRIAEARRP